MITDLDQFHRPSLGTELIESLRDDPKSEDKVSIVRESIIEESVPEVIPDEKNEPQTNGFASYIQNGVEVIDVKAPSANPKPSRQVDKWGIPIQPGEHRNFDRI